MAVDPKTVLQTYLASVSAITTLTSTRIYGPPGLPENAGDITDIAQTITYFVISAQGDSDLTNFHHVTFEINCYGGTPLEAQQLFNTVHAALHNLYMRTVGSNKIVGCAELPGRMDGQDPDNGEWDVVNAQFEAVMY